MLKNRDAIKGSIGRPGVPLAAFWEHFGLPWATLCSIIRELFSGLVPGRAPRWILGDFLVAFGRDLDGFGRFLGVLSVE